MISGLHGANHASTLGPRRPAGRRRGPEAQGQRARAECRSRAPHHIGGSSARRPRRVLATRRSSPRRNARPHLGPLGGTHPPGSGRAVRIVVDASVALKWVLDEPGSEAAVALRDHELVAPTLWLAEAANALWRHARIGEISNDEAIAYFAELLKAPVASLPIEPQLEPALKLAMEIGHPIYDC